MFFRILKKELKRKKTLNMILFLFITIATMFLASSVSNLITVMGAVDHFIAISKVPDNFAVAISDGKNEDIIESYLQKAEEVTDYEVIKGFNIDNEGIDIQNSQSNNKKYERMNSLALQPVPENFMKVFDINGNPLVLKPGEIALSKLEAEENQLSIGDKIKITIGEVEKEFTVKTLTKDVVFGSAMMGFKRHFISQEDFCAYENQKETVYTKTYCVNYTDKDTFQKKWQKQNFSILSTVDKDIIPMCYVFDMLMAGVLIIVSICLIFISFFVLRFTIVFTLQGDFREIGIMKAIGLKDRGIKGIYLIKYLILSLTGAIAGLLLSFPFGKMLLEQVVVNLVIDTEKNTMWVSVLCAIGIVIVVLLFANSCTGKLKKFTAIDAIRNGSNGERYKAKNALKLWKRKTMQPGFYMACNDILSNPKRFITLAMTFCIGTLLILLPLSAVHTLTGENIISLFSMCPSDVYVDNGKSDEYLEKKDFAVLEKDLNDMENTLKKHGITAKAGTDLGFSIPCYGNDKEELVTYFTLQEFGGWDRSYTILEGREPKASDEMMITAITAEEMGVGIGDTITYQYPDREQEFIITGTFQSMMNMGHGFRVSRKANMDANYFSGFFGMQIEVEDMESDEAYEKIKEIFPNYKIMQAQGFLANMIGSIVEQLDVLILLLTVVVAAINGLITILTMKTMLSKERGDVALLKSIGFKNRSIRGWQVKRILLILTGAILIGSILSKVLAPVTIEPIFAMMGASHVELEIKPLETYLIYPAVLLFITAICAYISTAEIRKVDAKEVNTIE
ncbi:MAG: FtsX-like permease family protein [Lachnospiraceae bacterium]|nr:FtsX-like permease family protein [Lachnospiraceae bacterium]